MNFKAAKFVMAPIFFRFLALLMSVFCFAAGAKEMDFGNNYSNSTAPKKSTFFNYDSHYQLQDYLSSNPRSVTDFVKLLPADLRMSYTLVYNSGSIQEASYRNPRVVMFSPLADLVLTFNGHADMVGGDSVEAIQYDSLTDRYVFHEILFSDKGPQDIVNPRKCQACHTDGDIPNWHSYNAWMGAYGGIGDRFDIKITPVMKGADAAILVDDKDKQQLAEFLGFSKSMSTNGDRYALLTNPGTGEMWPFEPYPTGKYIEAPELDYQPNRRLTVGLFYHLSRMLGARLKRSQLYRDYPANIVSQLLECDPKNTEFIKILRQAKNRSVLRYGDIDYGWGELKEKWLEYNKSHPTILYPFLNALSVTGVLPEYWVPNPFSRSPNLSVMTQTIGYNVTLTSYTGFDDMNEAPLLAGLYLYGELAKQNLSLSVPETGVTNQLASEVGVSFDQLTALGKIIPLYEHDDVMAKICPKLAPVVQQELDHHAPIRIEISSIQQQKYERWKRGVPYVIDRCITCHAQGNFAAAPYIPFDQPKLLRAQLHADHDALLNEIIKRTNYEASDDIRMPKGPFPILPAQQAQLIEYLKSL